MRRVRFTSLKWMAVSPLHYKNALENPFDPTPAMDFGTLVHEIVLGGDGFVVWPGDRRAGKEWDTFKAANQGKLIVKRDEFARAEQAALAVLANPDAARLVRESQRERSWEAIVFGREARGRIDMSGSDTAELKVTPMVDPIRFQRHAMRMGWHSQVAWYQEARRMMGEDPGRGLVIAVEPKPPHAVTVFRFGARALEEGLRQCRLWVERLNQCEAADHWPAYSESIVEIDIAESVEMDLEGEAA